MNNSAEEITQVKFKDQIDQEEEQDTILKKVIKLLKNNIQQDLNNSE